MSEVLNFLEALSVIGMAIGTTASVVVGIHWAIEKFKSK